MAPSSTSSSPSASYSAAAAPRYMPCTYEYGGPSFVAHAGLLALVGDALPLQQSVCASDPWPETPSLSSPSSRRSGTDDTHAIVARARRR